jgi:esterase/lipase superfamily enzyme
MERQYTQWESPHLGRTMELLWFGHAGRPVVVFPTSMGRFFQYEDFGLIGGLAPLIEAGTVQFCCVDSVDAESWYNKGAPPPARVRRHDQYDRYVREEVFHYVRQRARRDDFVLFGCSFGGFHVMNLACRYPDEVTKAIAFSGIYDIHNYLDGYWDELCYFHCPTAFVPNLNGEWIGRLSRVGFVIATGEHDHLAGENRRFIRILDDKGMAVNGEIWPGVFGHDWSFWTDHLPRFLP